MGFGASDACMNVCARMCAKERWHAPCVPRGVTYARVVSAMNCVCEREMCVVSRNVGHRITSNRPPWQNSTVRLH